MLYMLVNFILSICLSPLFDKRIKRLISLTFVVFNHDPTNLDTETGDPYGLEGFIFTDETSHIFCDGDMTCALASSLYSSLSE
mmetsp:Transcript_24079/g.24541  ORF Transcript_24079/g.24541 Transcript_24079/m.24541 type:complete len:83 (+) Transcript_24079:139-387(+)